MIRADAAHKTGHKSISILFGCCFPLPEACQPAKYCRKTFPTSTHSQESPQQLSPPPPLLILIRLSSQVCMKEASLTSPPLPKGDIRWVPGAGSNLLKWLRSHLPDPSYSILQYWPVDIIAEQVGLDSPICRFRCQPTLQITGYKFSRVGLDTHSCKLHVPSASRKCINYLGCVGGTCTTSTYSGLSGELRATQSNLRRLKHK